MSKRVRRFHNAMALLFFIGTIAFLIWKQHVVPGWVGLIMIICAYSLARMVETQMSDANAHVATRSKNT